jgi:D-arabinose 5-phosphate isomerase GutQ
MPILSSLLSAGARGYGSVRRYSFKDIVRLNISRAETVLSLMDKLTNDSEKAVEIVPGCKGRVIMTGMGKSGFEGGKVADTRHRE